MSTAVLRIAQVGGFDADNYGDALFPLLADEALRPRLGDGLEIVVYGFRDLPAGLRPYAVRDLARLPREIAGFDLLLLGGGQLVRGDPLGPAFPPSGAQVDDPLGIWLIPTLTALLAGVPVAWNAPGVSPTIPPALDPVVATVSAAVDHLTVRDEQSARWFSERGGGAATVVPDSAFALARRLPRRGPRAAELLLRSGVGRRPYVVLQPSPELSGHRDAVQRAVSAAVDAGRAVLELPIGPVNGDVAGRLDPLPHPTCGAPWWPEPSTIAELIAGADAAIGSSFHLGVTAVAAGVPLLRPPSPPGWKYEALEALPGVAPLDAPLTLGARGPSTEVLALADRVEAHWDGIAALLGAAGRRPQATATVPASTAATQPPR